jgi:putative redox protein
VLSDINRTSLSALTPTASKLSCGPKWDAYSMIRSSSLDAPFQVSFTNGEIASIADVPKDKGGAGCGFGPHQLLEAALATCLTITLRKFAAEHHFPLESAAVEVRLDRSQAPDISLVYTFRLEEPLTTE